MKNFTVRLPKDIQKQLLEYSNLTDLPVSWCIRAAIKEYLKRQTLPKKEKKS